VIGLLGLLELVAQIGRLVGTAAVAVGVGTLLSRGQALALGTLLLHLLALELLGRHVVGHHANHTPASVGVR